MKITRVSILLALAAILAATLACGGPTAPTASNFYMASDEAGKVKTTVFTSTDAFYVFFDVSGIQTGTTFEADWYALNVSGTDPNTPFKTTTYDYESGVTTIYFQLTNSSGWPTGSYRVEVKMNGTKVGEQQFSVQ